MTISCKVLHGKRSNVRATKTNRLIMRKVFVKREIAGDEIYGFI